MEKIGQCSLCTTIHVEQERKGILIGPKHNNIAVVLFLKFER